MVTVPDTFKREERLVESLKEAGISPGPALQFRIVVEIGFVTGEANEVALAEVGERAEIKSAQGEAQIAFVDQLASETGPAVFGKLIGGDIFLVEIRGDRN